MRRFEQEATAAAALDLAYVARFEGFWEEGLNPWDVAFAFLHPDASAGRGRLAIRRPLPVRRAEANASRAERAEEGAAVAVCALFPVPPLDADADGGGVRPFRARGRAVRPRPVETPRRAQRVLGGESR